MSETSVKIRDDTVPKTVDIRSHCKVWLRAYNNLLQPPPYISVFWGCGRLLHALNHTLQWLLVSTVFGTVSSLHLISDFYTCIYTPWLLSLELLFHIVYLHIIWYHTQEHLTICDSYIHTTIKC